MAFWSSIRFSLRILKKHWKLTSIAIFSLAIAMAAGAVGFSIFNALLLRPPAVPAPEQLVSIYTSTPTEEFNGTNYTNTIATTITSSPTFSRFRIQFRCAPLRIKATSNRG
jgi:hypothetical protein